MPRAIFFCLIVSYLIVPSQSFSFPKSKKNFPRPVVFERKEEIQSKLKLNSQFGFNFVSGTAITAGFQMGRRMTKFEGIYLGPELSFMAFSPGSILNVLLGGWFENHFFNDQTKTIDLGISIGAGFSNKRALLKTTNLTGLIDVSYSQKVDETLTLRVQVRSGLIGSSVIGSLNFNAQFGFL